MQDGAQADALADMHIRQTLCRVGAESRFGQRHGADVLVDYRRKAQVLLEERGDRDVLPAEML